MFLITTEKIGFRQVTVATPRKKIPLYKGQLWKGQQIGMRGDLSLLMEIEKRTTLKKRTHWTWRPEKEN